MSAAKVGILPDDLRLLMRWAALAHLPSELAPALNETLQRSEAALAEADGVTEPEQPADGQVLVEGGQWMEIAFMGHNVHVGYVTEITKNSQPGYRIDLPEKVWGGDPHAVHEYSAAAWFSDHPVTEESVRRAWAARVRAAEERRRRQEEYDRMREQRAITAAGADDESDDLYECTDSETERQPF